MNRANVLAKTFERLPEERQRMQPTLLPDGARPTRPGRHWLTGIIVFLFVIGILIESILPRVKARTVLRSETAEMAVPTVSVVQPKRSAPTQEVVLPGSVQHFITAAICFRTDGYLRRWYVDIGARVHAGQLLAEIETPEVDQQLRQSLSNVSTAEANLRLAAITKERYQGLLKSNAVAQQDVDNAVGTYNANKAIVEANQANVKQLEALQSFEKI